MTFISWKLLIEQTRTFEHVRRVPGGNSVTRNYVKPCSPSTGWDTCVRSIMSLLVRDASLEHRFPKRRPNGSEVNIRKNRTRYTWIRTWDRGNDAANCSRYLVVEETLLEYLNVKVMWSNVASTIPRMYLYIAENCSFVSRYGIINSIHTIANTGRSLCSPYETVSVDIETRVIQGSLISPSIYIFHCYLRYFRAIVI